jgi:hypothetical protein
MKPQRVPSLERRCTTCAWPDEENELNSHSCQGGVGDDSRSIAGEGHTERDDRAVGVGWLRPYS